MELEEVRAGNGREISDKKEPKSRYPKHVFLIIGNEFCERFSFYGMRTVLVLYARNYLMFDSDTSTAIFHAFTFFAYFFPLVGGIIGDSYLGKYKTILYLSLVYVFGHVVKTLAAIPYIPSNAAHIGLSMLGLLLIAIGTGGIKPCVSAFGGDQFDATQTKYQRQFFSMFYFSINAGALISKFITPLFRADLNCYPGKEGPEFKECYAMAFGIPGLLMLFAVGFFVAGSKYYTRSPLSENVFWKFCKCIYSALRNKWKSRKEKHEPKGHFIDYADASASIKKDTKIVLKVLLLFTPLPFFWALFDQQGSRWTLQALQLDGHWGSFLVKPEQMDVLNPLLIITLIPLFEFTLYPLLRHCNINFSAVRRMAAGLFLAGLSFVFASILQFNIDKGITTMPTMEQFSIRVVNMAPCDVTLQSANLNFNNLTVYSKQASTRNNFQKTLEPLSFTYKECTTHNPVTVDLKIEAGKMLDVIVYGYQAELYKQTIVATSQLENGEGSVTFINLNYFPRYIMTSSGNVIRSNVGVRSSVLETNKGKSQFSVYYSNTSINTFNGSFEVQPAGVYTVLLTNNSSFQLTDMNPNTINIAWMIPQYFILTVSEVFLSITGLEFSYTQAPQSMKSVVTSFWLLTVAFGSLIVLFVAKAKPIEQQAYEFLLFAGLIAVAGFIFILLAKRYKEVGHDAEEDFSRKNFDEDDIIDEENKLIVSDENSKDNFT